MFIFIGDPNCPVKLYKLYADKRPEEANQPNAKFYICKNPFYGKPQKNGNTWFIKQSMGVNHIGQLAKTMSEKAGLSGNHTNHSGRKTCITKLLDANVPPIEVAQLSGHKNLMSLNHYNSVNLNKQMQMSSILHTVGEMGDQAQLIHTEFNDTSLSDDELIIASQEIEETLSVIQVYENKTVGQVVDLPLVQKADGSLEISNNSKISPESFFQNCTFNASVNITLK